MNESTPKTGLTKWLPLFMLSLGFMAIILDTTILNVSLRAMIIDLKTDIQSIQWVITAYSLMLAAFTITGGRLGDLFGRKRMFIVGAIIFAIGSFIASISNTVGMLILGEAIIEGVGAALMMPATMSLIVSNYKGRDRQISFGVWGAIAGGAAALGPVAGGWLTTYSTWRWAFRINVVVVALLLLGSRFISEAMDREEKPSLDVVGVILSAVGLLGVVFGFIQASEYGWLTMKKTVTLAGLTFAQGTVSPVLFIVAAGLAVLGLFAWWEHMMAKRHQTPLVSLALFKNSQFTIAVSIVGLLSLGMAGLSFAVPVFLQAVKHLNALDTGLAMLPMTLTLLVAAPMSAVLSKHIAPKRIVQAGIIAGGLGFVGLRMGIQVDASPWAMAPGFMLFGAGMGFMMSQLSNMAISSVSVQEAGEVSGVNSTFRTVGQALGAAIMGAVLISVMSSGLVSGVMKSSVIPASQKQMLSEAMRSQSSSIEFGGDSSNALSKLPPAVAEEITQISGQATVDAAHATLLLGAGLMVIAFILSLKLPNSKDIEVEKSIAVVH